MAATQQPERRQTFSPFLSPEVAEDLVPLVFHFAVDAVDGDLLDQRLQCSTKVLHTRARADGETEAGDVSHTHTHEPLTVKHKPEENQLLLVLVLP